MSALGLPTWLPLAQLRETVAEHVGEAESEAAVATIMTAIETGQVPVRWSGELFAWRFRERENGRELQDATGAHTHGLVPYRPGMHAFTFDQAEGIALAACDPAERGRPGAWPVGPVDVSWPHAAHALARAAKAAQAQRGAA